MQGGVYMYGAVLLALHGEVVLDTVTSMVSRTYLVVNFEEV